MGKAMAAEHELARLTFEEADDVLGIDLSRLCFDGPADDLNLTLNCQPATIACSVAAWRVAVAQGATAGMVIGHSLGEYSALVAAGSLDLADALRLSVVRGQVTGEVARRTPGAMAAVLGVSDEEVAALCESAGEIWPANFNSPGQVVVSGRRQALSRLMELAAARKIKVRPLEIEGAFHCPLMEPARDGLEQAIAQITLRVPEVPFLSATTATLEHSPERIAQMLSDQLTSAVRFTEAINLAGAAGVSRFVEFGCRRVLAGLVRRIAPDADEMLVAEPADLAGLIAPQSA